MPKNSYTEWQDFNNYEKDLKNKRSSLDNFLGLDTSNDVENAYQNRINSEQGKLWSTRNTVEEENQRLNALKYNSSSAQREVNKKFEKLPQINKSITTTKKDRTFGDTLHDFFIGGTDEQGNDKFLKLFGKDYKFGEHNTMQKVRDKQVEDKTTVDEYIKKYGYLPKNATDKEKQAYYDRFSQETGARKNEFPNWIKESRIIGSMANAMAQNSQDSTNMLIQNNSRHNGSALGNVATDMVGYIGGLALNPGGGMNGKNLLTVSDDLVNNAVNKGLPKLGNISSSITKGAIDGGIGGALDTLRTNDTNNLGRNIMYGTVGGGAIRGGASGIGSAKQLIKDYKNLPNMLDDVIDGVSNDLKTVETNTIIPNNKNTRITTQQRPKTQFEQELANARKIVNKENKRISNVQENLTEYKNPKLRNLDLEEVNADYEQQVKRINDEIARRKAEVENQTTIEDVKKPKFTADEKEMLILKKKYSNDGIELTDNEVKAIYDLESKSKKAYADFVNNTKEISEKHKYNEPITNEDSIHFQKQLDLHNKIENDVNNSIQDIINKKVTVNTGKTPSNVDLSNPGAITQADIDKMDYIQVGEYRDLMEKLGASQDVIDNLEDIQAQKSFGKYGFTAKENKPYVQKSELLSQEELMAEVKAFKDSMKPKENDFWNNDNGDVYYSGGRDRRKQIITDVIIKNEKGLYTVKDTRGNTVASNLTKDTAYKIAKEYGDKLRQLDNTGTINRTFTSIENGKPVYPKEHQQVLDLIESINQKYFTKPKLKGRTVTQDIPVVRVKKDRVKLSSYDKLPVERKAQIDTMYNKVESFVKSNKLKDFNVYADKDGKLFISYVPTGKVRKVNFDLSGDIPVKSKQGAEYKASLERLKEDLVSLTTTARETDKLGLFKETPTTENVFSGNVVNKSRVYGELKKPTEINPTEIKQTPINNISIESVAKDLGIDINSILDKMAKAERLTPKEVAQYSKWKRIIGIADKPQNIVGINKYVPRNPNIPKDIPKINLKPITKGTPSSNVNTPKIKKNLTKANVSGNIAMQEVASTKANVDGNGVSRIPHKILFSDEVAKENLSIIQKAKNYYDNFRTRFIDINSPLEKKVNKETHMLATNSKTSGSIVSSIIDNNLTDRNGNVINKPLKDIVKDTPREFYEYMAQRVNQYRASRGKNVIQNTDVLDSVKAVSEWEKLNPEWKAKGDELTKWVDDFMKTWGVDTGIIESDFYNALRQMEKDYLPMNRIVDETDITKYMNGKGFVNQNVPVAKAKGNSAKDIQHPVENIINMVDRVVKTAKYNEVGQSVYNDVIKNPTKYDNIIKLVDETKADKNNIVSVLIDGKKHYMEINDKGILNSLESLYKTTSSDKWKYIKKASEVYRDLITQYNPLFAFFNGFRDMQNYLINSSEKNVFKNLYNLGSAYSDILTKADVYKQYKAVGGGGGNLSKSNAPIIARELVEGKKINPKTVLNAPLKAISGFNNAIENAPRLAEFKNTLAKGDSVDQALFNSLDITTNFSRGGDITKTANELGGTFLNASVQGLNKTVRQTIEHPIATTVKGVAVVTTPTLLLNYYNKNDKNYQKLDNRTKDTYYIFPDLNKDGKYFKLPKSRDFGTLFGALTERLIRQHEGDELAFKGYGNTLINNLAPVDITKSNMYSPVITNLFANKDFANRTIVPENLLGASPRNQYDETTSEIGKKIGELMNWSPKKVDYLIDSYSGIIGDILLPSTTKNTNINPVDKIFTNKFIADSVYNNQPTQDFYDTKNNLERINKDNSIEGKENLSSLDSLRSEYNKLAKDISDVNKKARGENNKELARLYKQKIQEDIQFLNNKAKKQGYLK